jgi:hypothetical protein
VPRDGLHSEIDFRVSKTSASIIETSGHRGEQVYARRAEPQMPYSMADRKLLFRAGNCALTAS